MCFREDQTVLPGPVLPSRFKISGTCLDLDLIEVIDNFIGPLEVPEILSGPFYFS